jgi:hypothetical protein
MVSCRKSLSRISAFRRRVWSTQQRRAGGCLTGRNRFPPPVFPFLTAIERIEASQKAGHEKPPSRQKQPRL